jgi:hypothetical protein
LASATSPHSFRGWSCRFFSSSSSNASNPLISCRPIPASSQPCHVPPQHRQPPPLCHDFDIRDQNPTGRSSHGCQNWTVVCITSSDDFSATMLDSRRHWAQPWGSTIFGDPRYRHWGWIAVGNRRELSSRRFRSETVMVAQ